MAYLGRTQLKASDIKLKAATTISGSSTNTVALTWDAPNEQSLVFKINGVTQNSTDFTIAGSPTTITLASGNFADGSVVEVVGINDIGTAIVPADGSVTPVKMATTSSGATGEFLKKTGAATIDWAEVPSGIEWQSVQTTGFTAVAGKGYPCNTTASYFTVTLPASASVGDEIAIVDYAGTFDTNKITIDPNGLKLKGATSSLNVQTERASLTLTYLDVTQGWVASSGVNTATPALAPLAYDIDFLVVGGGGAGGKGIGGGGGAGGFRTSTETVGSGVVITLSVGDGGAAAGGSTNSSGNVGNASSMSGSGLTTISSAGGGYGGGYNIAGGAGGSGGGGSVAQAAGAGNTPSTTPSQGSAGGAGSGDLGAATSSGGGGGATSVGSTAASNQGGNGGAGTVSTITGASVTYAGGGGGSTHSGGGSAGTGGAGGGSAGGDSGASTTVSDATVNTGGGGGGNGYYTPNGNPSGAGGKGVIILSMPDESYTGTTTGSPTVATGVSGKTILTFTGTGSYTT